MPTTGLEKSWPSKDELSWHWALLGLTFSIGGINPASVELSSVPVLVPEAIAN